MIEWIKKKITWILVSLGIVSLVLGAPIIFPETCNKIHNAGIHSDSNFFDNKGIRKLSIERSIVANQRAQKVVDMKCISKVRITNQYFDGYIEVVSFQKFNNGVTAYVRAWDADNNQIGFGKDGTVDIERININNPLVLVSDPMGNFKRTVELFDGTTYEDNYREDVYEYALYDLAHTIKVKQQKHGSENIIAGKIGETTSTFNPDAHTESTSVDGRAAQNICGCSWASLRGGTGNLSNDIESVGLLFRLTTAVTTDEWGNMTRSIFLFDTSTGIGSDTIDSATMSVYVTSKIDQLSISPDINVYSSAPASNTAVVNGDYDSLGTTDYATAIAWASITTSAFNDFTLNATGIAAIDTAGITKFGVRNKNYDADNNDPTWGSDLEDNININYAENGSNIPKLVVEHSAAAVATEIIRPDVIWFD